MQPSLFRHAPKLPVTAVGDLIAALRGQGWRTRAQIRQQLQWPDRLVRLAAQHSAGQIISGQRGLKCTCEATPEEMAAVIAQLSHRVSSEQQRIRDTEKAWHTRRGVAA